MPNRYASYNIDAPEYEEDGNLRVHRIPLPDHASGMVDQSKAFLVFARKTLRIARRNDYDMVYASSSRLMTAVLGSWVSRRKKIPLYLDIRDIFVDTINDVLPGKLTRSLIPVFSMLERFAIQRAKVVNLVSGGFYSYFKQRYPNQKYVCYTNGIDNDFLNVVPGPVQESSADIVTLLYAGNIGEGQGLHRIVPHLASELGDGYFIKIIGDGGRRRELEEAIKTAGVNNVSLAPPVPRDTLLQEYAQSDILFMHLNDYDAFKKVLPSKVFEYGAMGKPILAGVSGYAAQFISDEVSNAVVFSPCDAKGAVAALQTLQLKTVMRDSFVDKFSRAHIMDQMADDVIATANQRG